VAAFGSDVLDLFLGAVGEVAGVLVVGHDELEIGRKKMIGFVIVVVIVMVIAMSRNAQWSTYGTVSSPDTVVMPYR